MTKLTKGFLPYPNTVQVTDFVFYFTKSFKQKQNPKRESCWITVLSEWVITFILIHRKQKENPRLNYSCANFPKGHKRKSTPGHPSFCHQWPTQPHSLSTHFSSRPPQNYLETNSLSLTISSVNISACRSKRKSIIPTNSMLKRVASGFNYHWFKRRTYSVKQPIW